MTERTEFGGRSRFARLTVSRWRALVLILLAVGVGASISSCSSGSASPGATNQDASTTTSTAGSTGQTSGTSTSAQQTVETWFREIDAKNPSAPSLLEQPFRGDWTRTRVTSWPSFSNVSCQTISESATAATVHCGFDESRLAGEAKPTTAWVVHLVKQPDGTWLIARYGAS
jgi:hypothetical protein